MHIIAYTDRTSSKEMLLWYNFLSLSEKQIDSFSLFKSKVKSKLLAFDINIWPSQIDIFTLKYRVGKSTINIIRSTYRRHYKTRPQKQPSRGILRKSYSETTQQIYRRTPMPKCDFNKFAKQFYWIHTSAWVFSCKFAAYFQNNFS